MFFDSRPSVLLLSRDPGGANTVIPLIEPLTEAGFSVNLWGKDVALQKYEQAGYTGQDIRFVLDPLDAEALKVWLFREKPAFIITGTSGDDRVENHVWRAARECGIPTAAILDQWMSYGIRFSPYGVSQMQAYQADPDHSWCPDTIFVMDDEARSRLIALGFLPEQVLITGQPYFEWIQTQWAQKAPNAQQIQKQKKGIQPHERVITFVSEPLSQIYHDSKGSVNLGYTEKTTITAFLQTLDTLSKSEPENHWVVLIKLHPRENPENYTGLMEAFEHPRIRLLVDQQTPPWDILALTDGFIGMSSMLLIEAFIVNKPLLSIQIGLNQADPFVLSKRKLVSVVTDKTELASQLTPFLQAVGRQKNISSLPDVFTQRSVESIVRFVTQHLNTCHRI